MSSIQPMPGAKHQVGVLLVHGIGEQPQGDTLTRFAEPLVGWLERWVSRPEDAPGTPGAPPQPRSPGSVRITTTLLGTSGLPRAAPAHLIAEVDPGASLIGGIQPAPSSWLVAESWWAGEFRRPVFGELAGWLLTTGAWMVLSHAGRAMHLRRRWSWPWFVAVLQYVVSVPFALLVQLATVLVASAAILPIPKLRRALSGLLLALTGSIGDSYVLIANPVQRAAAVSRVRRDLVWLGRRCDHAVVVAHSQGAAIAHEVLRSPEPLNVRLFVSLGSGLAKLEELSFVKRSRPILFRLTQIAILIAGLAVAFSPRLLPLAGQKDNFLAFASLFYPAAFLLAVLILTWEGLRTFDQHVTTLALRRGDRFKWVDYFATNDPVPNGQLGPVEGLTSREVVNEMSLLHDHSAYWDNGDEFVASVLREIDGVATTGLFAPGDGDRLDRASPARRWRVRLLNGMRLAACAGLVMTLIGLWPELGTIGEVAVYGVLKGAPGFNTVEEILTYVGRLGRPIASVVLGPAERDVPGALLVMLGGLVPSAFWFVWYRVTLGLWRGWDRLETRRLFRPRAFPNAPSDRVFLPAAIVFIGLAPISVAIATLVSPDFRTSWSTVLSIGHKFGLLLLGVLLTVGVIAAVIGIGGQAFRMTMKLWRRLIPG